MAREPEPDVDFDELGDELEETPPARGSRPRPVRTSSRKPIHWILFLLIAAAGGVFAYDPEMVMDLLGLAPHQPPPPMVAPPPKPRPPAPTTQAPAPTSMPPTATTVPGAGPAAPPPPASTPMPRFAEGQRVTVMADPAAPAQTVTLSPDPAGSRPGPAIQAGAMLIVTDGELHDSGWVYSVRTADGLTGWVPEKRLISQQ